MAGAIESTQVPMLFEKVDKQTVSGEFTGSFSSATGTPSVLALAGNGAVFKTVQRKIPRLRQRSRGIHK